MTPEVETKLAVRHHTLDFEPLSKEKCVLIALIREISPGWASHFMLRWPTSNENRYWTVLGLNAHERMKAMLLW